MKSSIRPSPILRFVMLSVTISAPVMAAPRSNDTPLHLKYRGATKGASVREAPVVWLDEATEARGSVAGTEFAEAHIFHQANDSGRGVFLKSDDTFGFGTWGTRMVFGNGWTPGGTISSYEARFHRSRKDSWDISHAEIMLELWDGDPMGIMETVCSLGGVSAPIPGTRGIVGGILRFSLAQARVELAEPITYDCDRVWMVMTMLSGCHATWRIAGDPDATTAPYGLPAEVGESDGLWMQWPCEAFGACPTQSGYSVGTCCNSGEPCDNTEEITNCQFCYETVCPDTPAFCGDGTVDYFTGSFDLGDDEWDGLVGSIFAPTKTVLEIVPVSVDAPPSVGGVAGGGGTISGHEVVLPQGGHQVWFDVRVSDWDPNDEGVELGAWQATFDSRSLTSGTKGTLTPYVGSSPCGACSNDASSCFRDDDCAAPATCAVTTDGNTTCEAQLGAGSVCGPSGYYLGSGACSFAFTDPARADAVRFDSHLPATHDLSGPDAVLGMTSASAPLPDPEPFPTDGLYAATIALTVPFEAKGTFTINLRSFPQSYLLVGDGSPIPLLGIVPAKISIEYGACCYNLQWFHGPWCLDGNQTYESCSRQSGVTVFRPNVVCPDVGGPPCECDPNDPSTFEDGDACTDDACINGVETSTPRFCDDGLVCTTDACDSDDPAGIGCFTTFDAGYCFINGACFVDGEANPENLCQECRLGASLTEWSPATCDDGLSCTTDACVEPSGCAFNPVDVDDGNPCTVDRCTEPGGNILHQDLGRIPNAFRCATGDPVFDGCPAEATTCALGYCRCFPCGDGILDPGEVCDGADDSACFGRCRDDCQCPSCGDGVLDDGEECDGSDDDACPGLCQDNCTCPSTIPATNHWGLAVFALLLLIVAKHHGRRREILCVK